MNDAASRIAITAPSGDTTAMVLGFGASGGLYVMESLRQYKVTRGARLVRVCGQDISSYVCAEDVYRLIQSSPTDQVKFEFDRTSSVASGSSNNISSGGNSRGSGGRGVNSHDSGKRSNSSSIGVRNGGSADGSVNKRRNSSSSADNDPADASLDLSNSLLRADAQSKNHSNSVHVSASEVNSLAPSSHNTELLRYNTDIMTFLSSCGLEDGASATFETFIDVQFIEVVGDLVILKLQGMLRPLLQSQCNADTVSRVVSRVDKVMMSV